MRVKRDECCAPQPTDASATPARSDPLAAARRQKNIHVTVTSANSDEMRMEIKRLHQRLGSTIVYVTHDQIEAMTLATRIAVMRAGQFVEVGPAEQVLHQPENDYTRELLSAVPELLALAAAKVASAWHAADGQQS